jgi:hypothetical protein
VKTRLATPPMERLRSLPTPPCDSEADAPYAESVADAFQALRLSSARDALSSGNYAAAVEWLDGIPLADRPSDLVAKVEYGLAKEALRASQWAEAEHRLGAAAKTKLDPLYPERLSLIRKRSPLMDDHAWRAMDATVAPAGHMPEQALRPAVRGVWACGAYFSRGHLSGSPWSRFLRGAKDATEDREAMLTLATGFLCRFIAGRTPLLGLVDLVVPIPANPDRYGSRMLSLPDEMARSVQAQLAVPMRFEALSHSGEDVKLSELSWADRRLAVRRTLVTGDARGLTGRTVLVVDDITTSGATLRRAAQLLTDEGAAAVYAICLAHTEG